MRSLQNENRAVGVEVQGIADWMMTIRGKLCVRAARSAQDMAAVMALRHARFGVGEDRYDAGAFLIMIGPEDGPIDCCFRLIPCLTAAEILASYSAQFYDLTQIAQIAPAAVELGRFCMIAGAGADVLRLAFAAMTRVVEDHGAGLLFGCSSFHGAEVTPHLPALQVLQSHIAPYPIGRKSPHAIAYAPGQATAEGLRQVPPLLRSYLALGGWVSDHGVQDFDLDTLHVFTGVEIAKIPAARAENLRALAGGMVWDV